jgi:hypothetical protein
MALVGDAGAKICPAKSTRADLGDASVTFFCRRERQIRSLPIASAYSTTISADFQRKGPGAKAGPSRKI